MISHEAKLYEITVIKKDMGGQHVSSDSGYKSENRELDLPFSGVSTCFNKLHIKNAINGDDLFRVDKSNRTHVHKYIEDRSITITVAFFSKILKRNFINNLTIFISIYINNSILHFLTLSFYSTALKKREHTQLLKAKKEIIKTQEGFQMLTQARP